MRKYSWGATLMIAVVATGALCGACGSDDVAESATTTTSVADRVTTTAADETTETTTPAASAVTVMTGEKICGELDLAAIGAQTSLTIQRAEFGDPPATCHLWFEDDAYNPISIDVKDVSDLGSDGAAAFDAYVAQAVGMTEQTEIAAGDRGTQFLADGPGISPYRHAATQVGERVIAIEVLNPSVVQYVDAAEMSALLASVATLFA